MGTGWPARACHRPEQARGSGAFCTLLIGRTDPWRWGILYPTSLGRATTICGMRTYYRRIVDDELDELLPHLSAISLDGLRGVGKTTTALQRATTVFRMDNPETLEIVAADPRLITSAPEPVLVDEWQRYPATWDIVRRAVDDDPRPGRFILTGSATPSVRPTHSGAGRIVSIRMRPWPLRRGGRHQPHGLPRSA